MTVLSLAPETLAALLASGRAFELTPEGGIIVPAQGAPARGPGGQEGPQPGGGWMVQAGLSAPAARAVPAAKKQSGNARRCARYRARKQQARRGPQGAAGLPETPAAQTPRTAAEVTTAEAAAVNCGSREDLPSAPGMAREDHAGVPPRAGCLSLLGGDASSPGGAGVLPVENMAAQDEEVPSPVEDGAEGSVAGAAPDEGVSPQDQGMSSQNGCLSSRDEGVSLRDEGVSSEDEGVSPQGLGMSLQLEGMSEGGVAGVSTEVESMSPQAGGAADEGEKLPPLPLPPPSPQTPHPPPTPAPGTTGGQAREASFALVSDTPAETSAKASSQASAEAADKPDSETGMVTAARTSAEAADKPDSETGMVTAAKTSAETSAETAAETSGEAAAETDAGTSGKTDAGTHGETGVDPASESGGGKNGRRKRDGERPPKPPVDDAAWLVELQAQPCYATLNVLHELGKMQVWCSARPGRIPSRRRFVNWLNRAETPLATSPPGPGQCPPHRSDSANRPGRYG